MSLLKNTFVITQTVTKNATTAGIAVPAASRLLGMYLTAGTAPSTTAVDVTINKNGTTTGKKATLAVSGTSASLLPTTGLASAKAAIDASFKDVQGATVTVQTIKDNTGTEDLKVGRDGWYDNTVGGKDQGVNYLAPTFPADSVLLDVATGDVITLTATNDAAVANITATLLWEKI